MTSISPLHRFLLAAGLGAAIGFAAPVASTAAAQDAPSADAERGPNARGRRHRRHGRRRGMRRMMREIGVTDAQREQMRAIRRTSREQGRSLRESGDRAAMRAHRRAVRERIQAILTPEQRARARELRAQHGQRMMTRRLERMSERLELSPTQVQQVGGILRHAHSQRRAIREAARTDGNPPRDAMQALRAQTRDQLRSVLNDAQEARLGEMRGRHRGRRGHRGHRGRGGPHGH